MSEATDKLKTAVQKVDSHNNFFVFTGALVFLLVTSAYVSSSPAGEHHRFLQGVMFLVEMVAYFSLNLSRRWRVFVIVMLALQLLTNILRETTQLPSTPIISLTANLIFFCGMAWAAARQVIFAGDIEANTIAGTVAVYLLLGLIWVVLYLMALEVWPNAFNGIDYRNWNDNFGVMTYYSYVTMTTLGYGDISPAAPVPRVLAYLQAVVGTFYMAVVVASFVGALRKNPN